MVESICAIFITGSLTVSLWILLKIVREIELRMEKYDEHLRAIQIWINKHEEWIQQHEERTEDDCK